MSLNFSGVPNQLFNTSNESEDGMSGRRGKVDFWTCSGVHFDATNPDVNDIVKDSDEGFITATGNAITFVANVNLPHGATITKVKISGNAAAAAESYWLNRSLRDTIDVDVIATANINTAISAVSNGTVDNENYIYFFATSSLDAGDAIYGGSIEYIY